MSTYKSSTHRFWATMFVLFYLITTLLSAHTATAAGLTSSCAGATEQASAASANQVVPASADQVMVISNRITLVNPGDSFCLFNAGGTS